MVKQPPAVFEVTGGGAYCSDAISGPVGLSGSENNINYQLYLNGQTKGSPVSGTGNTLDFGSQNAVGTYTVVASSPSNLCSTQMNGNAVITSITPPANFALSPSSSAYCEGSSGVSLTLSASENNVVYALKEISSGTPKVIGSLNGNVSGGSLVWNNILEGKYIVEAARGACVKEMNGSVAVTIIKNKLFAVTATSDAGANPICQGTSTVLHASAEAGTTVKSYSWSATSGGGLTNTNIANPTASPSNSSTYTVVITDANGCSSSGQVDVQVNAKPTAAINYQNVICEGTSTTLVATGGVASGSNTGYLWNTGATADVIAVSPSTTTAYSVTVTNSYGCTDSRTVMLTVRPKPGVDAGIDQVICAGEKATLHATTGVSGVVSDGYTWSTGETTSSIDVSPATTTNYTVTASKNYPSSVVLPDNIILPAIECTASDVVNVKVNQLPSVSFTDPSTDICYNASPITLDGKVTPAGTLGGSGVYTSPTAQAAISGADQFDPSKATVGSHTIIYTYNENVGNSKTCSASASKIIVVEQITAITSQPSDVATCEGTKASFLVAATGDGLTYQWYKGTKKLSDGGNISGSATTNLILQNVTTSDAGVYSCAISGSCGSVTSNAANLTVNEPIVANGQPVASQTLCEGATATFTYPVGGSNLVYQWKKGSTVLTD
ncbi:MAG: immunoglobulin domain-containing protein, partial [Bacteroidota bacterium]|nr:immunoglobulin domain-containing protein [Bacteroidota bacterium]